MSDFPLISIIIPAYNAGKWLIFCLNSIFNQTYLNWEAIIIDDGSQDDTLKIANKLAADNERVRVLHTKNGGVCRARNMGLEAAAGEFITFLDADDMLLPDALERLYGAIIIDDADIAIGWKTNIKEDGTDLGCPYRREKAILAGTQALEWSMSDHPAMYAVWGKLYKKEAIGNVRFVEGKRVHEDSFFVFQCCLNQPKVSICQDIVLQYRLSENSASRTEFSDKFFDILFFAKEKKALIENYCPKLIPLAKNVLVKANMALLRNLCKVRDSQYRTIEKNCIQSVIEDKAYYKTAIKSDQRWFFIITHRLYWPYKLLFVARRLLFSKLYR